MHFLLLQHIKEISIMKRLKSIVLMGLMVLFLLPACGGNKAGDPEQALRGMVQAAQDKDWGKVYDSFSKDSADQLEKMLKSFIQMAVGMAKMNPEAVKNNPQMKKMIELSELNGKEFFVKMFEIQPEMSNQIVNKMEDFKVLKKDVQGERAVLTIQSGGNQDTVPMVKEGGEWKIDLATKLKEQMSKMGQAKQSVEQTDEAEGQEKTPEEGK
jgi:hypothetical protein